MSSFLTNYLPSLVAALTTILTMLSPQIQSIISAHPSIAIALGSLYAILSHVIPGSPVPGSSLQK